MFKLVQINPKNDINLKDKFGVSFLFNKSHEKTKNQQSVVSLWVWSLVNT